MNFNKSISLQFSTLKNSHYLTIIYFIFFKVLSKNLLKTLFIRLSDFCWPRPFLQTILSGHRKAFLRKTNFRQCRALKTAKINFENVKKSKKRIQNQICDS